MEPMQERRCPRCGSEYTHANRRLGLWECEDCGHRFGSEEEGERLSRDDLSQKAEHPVKVFLSYPHSSREICAMICEALRRRGHDVWFDEEQIRTGDDWRARIAEGINGSSSVVSCLTRDAVRVEGGARGVCLDELSIALSTPGCVVQSVLLEPAGVVEPTAAIAHRQWLDMSDWQRKREEGEEEFAAWFDRMMLRLLEVVEGDESRAFAGEVQEVHDLLPLADRHMDNGALLGKPYVGREWLESRVDAWVEDRDGGALCALWGDPGVGKSAFAAHYAMRSPRAAASVRLAHDNASYNSAGAIAQSVAYQLAVRLPDYRQELLRALRSEKVGAMGASELVDLLFARPLAYRHVDGGHEQLCVIVDGLDECGAEAGDAVALVRGLREALPRWLKLLVLSRPEPDVVAALRPDCELRLQGAEADNMGDVRKYLALGLGDAVPDEDRREEAAALLAERSGGVFLFAEAVLGAVALGMDPLDATSYPTTLDESLHGWLERLFPGEEGARDYRDRFRLPLGAMLASPSPLPEEELGRLLGVSEADAGDLLLRMGTLIARGEDDFGERTVAVAHRYVADWLASEGAGRFRAPAGDGLRALASGCHKAATDDPDALTGYEATYAIPLARAAGMGAGLRELERSWGLANRSFKLGHRLNAQGRFAHAQALYEQALSICELRERELGTPESRGDLVRALGMAGTLAEELGDREIAEERCARALELGEQLASETEALETQWNFVKALDWAGGLALDRGDFNEARKHFERSLQSMEELVVKLENPEAWRDLCVAQERLGNLAHKLGDLASAEEYYRKSCALCEQLAKKHGTITTYRDLSVTYMKLGNLALICGRLDMAGSLFENSRQIREQLAQKPGTPQDLSNLSETLQFIGDLALQQGDLDAAEENYSRSLEQCKLAVEALDTHATRRSLSMAYDKLGRLAFERGGFVAAETYYRRAYELLEGIARELGTPEALRDLSGSLDGIGNASLNLNNVETAKKCYARSYALLKELDDKLGTPESRFDVAFTLNKLGICEAVCGNYAASEEYTTRSLELLEGIVRKRWTPTKVYDAMAQVQRRLGELALQREDLSAAEQRLARSMHLREALAEKLKTPGAIRKLSETIELLGDIALQRGDHAAAKKHFERLISLRKQLATFQDMKDLSESLEKAGDLALQHGDLDVADLYWMASAEARLQLAMAAKIPEAWQFLAAMLVRTGDLALRREDRKAAAECYQSAVNFLSTNGDPQGNQQSREALEIAKRKLDDVTRE